MACEYGCCVLPVLFHFTDVLKSHITGSEMLPADSPNMEKTWQDVGAIEELFFYLEGPFVEIMYGPMSYDGDWTYSDARPAGSTSFVHRRGWVIGGARLLGGIRVGQIRVGEKECDLPPEFVQDAENVWTCIDDSKLDVRQQLVSQRCNG